MVYVLNMLVAAAFIRLSACLGLFSVFLVKFSCPHVPANLAKLAFTF